MCSLVDVSFVETYIIRFYRYSKYNNEAPENIGVIESVTSSESCRYFKNINEIPEIIEQLQKNSTLTTAPT